MSSIYAMQRANGDWFALDDHGGFRVPLFRSSRDGMLARVRTSGMLLFKPVVLDEHALNNLVPADGVGQVRFWLVDNPFTDLSRGQFIDHSQLALLAHAGVQHPQVSRAPDEKTWSSLSVRVVGGRVH